jgi:hypothetical protein
MRAPSYHHVSPFFSLPQKLKGGDEVEKFKCGFVASARRLSFVRPFFPYPPPSLLFSMTQSSFRWNSLRYDSLLKKETAGRMGISHESARPGSNVFLWERALQKSLLTMEKHRPLMFSLSPSLPLPRSSMYVFSSSYLDCLLMLNASVFTPCGFFHNRLPTSYSVVLTLHRSTYRSSSLLFSLSSSTPQSS